MKISVFGSGYVGLVQATVLAEVGHDVICMDIDQKKVESLQQGHVSIFEPGLSALVRENLESKRLRFTSDEKTAVEHGEVLFIAVGTPPSEDGSADLGQVFSVGDAVARHRKEPLILVEKSTVPVGTGDALTAHINKALEQAGRSLQFDVVSNPEFLKEGSAVTDCRRPDRIIIGCAREEVREVMRDLYAPFNRNHDRIIFMDLRSAELTKYAANCMLATKISFMNEMANLAEMLGADIEMVRQGIGSDPRIGYQFLYAGVGYGGSCFPKDVQALIRTADSIDFDAKVLKAVESRNDEQKSVLFKKISKHFSGHLSGKTFALWGLSFKPNTDDMREAPSRVLIEALWKAGAKVQAYDPEAMEETQRIYGSRDDLNLCGTKEAALKGADALIILTEWQNFRAPDFELIKEQLIESLIFDGRNLYSPKRMSDKQFTYYSVGRQL